MMMITSAQQELFHAYEQTKSLVSEYAFRKPNFEEIEKRFEDKKQNPDLSIMVYGVYNAGKSTFINALIGEELAAMDDVPLTASVTAYPYKNYQILDTPGIDAPIEHEEIADEQLLKSDVVLFVVNPSGIVEEQATLEKLMDLFENRKKVFLIFNEKNELSESDFALLKEQTRTTLQNLAAKRGLTQEILGEIPIFKVNAKRALLGKIKQKEGLVNASGLNELELNLNRFIDEVIAKNEIYHALKENLLSFINDGISDLSANDAGELKKLYDRLAREIAAGKIDLRKDVKRDIKGAADELKQNVQTWLFEGAEDFEQRFQDWSGQKLESLSRDLEDYLVQIALKIQQDIDELQVKLPQLGLVDTKTSIQPTQFDSATPDVAVSGVETVDVDAFGKVLNMATKVQAEQLVYVMQIAKQLAPKLMEGIGQKTMERIAKDIVGKSAPVISAIVALYEWFKAHQNQRRREQEFREQQEEQRRAIERYNEQVKDAARQASDGFYMEVEREFMRVIDEYFVQFEDFLNEGLKAFSETEQRSSLLLAQFSELKQRLA